MKKVASFALFMLLTGSMAYAQDASVSIDLSGKDTTGLTLFASPDDATVTNATSIGKTSTGVGVAAVSNVNGYALITQHMNGTKAYGSAFDSTAIYQTIQDLVPGTAVDTTDFAAPGGELAEGTTYSETVFPDTDWRTM
jgi:hypothetical protein